MCIFLQQLRKSFLESDPMAMEWLKLYSPEGEDPKYEDMSEEVRQNISNIVFLPDFQENDAWLKYKWQSFCSCFVFLSHVYY